MSEAEYVNPTRDADAAATARPGPFIEVIEVWTPDESGERLTLASGIYGAHDDFAAITQGMSFAKGEGLPGKAWGDGQPIVLNGFKGTYFQRTEPAAASGLTTAVAIPSFAGDVLKGVLVLFCSDDKERIGALEVWREDPAQPGVLRLDDGYYGAAKHFEWISHRTQFPRGQGLPGGVWASSSAMLLRDLGASYRFVRSESAGAAGLTTGLGLPVETPGGELMVATLLSARSTPIAWRFELWDVSGAPGEAGCEATLVDGICEREGPLWEEPRTIAAWQGPIGEAAGSGAPVARSDAASVGLPAGYEAVVATPLYRKGRLAQIAAWYF